VVAAIIEATKVAENFMVSIEIPQQRFVGNRLDNERRRRVGGEIDRHAPNFSELQVALFGEYTIFGGMDATLLEFVFSYIAVFL
jgi:hypothetical protein